MTFRDDTQIWHLCACARHIQEARALAQGISIDRLRRQFLGALANVDRELQLAVDTGPPHEQVDAHGKHSR